LVDEDFKQLLRYGFPGPVYDIANRKAFTSVYDRRMRNPSWVNCSRGNVNKRLSKKLLKNDYRGKLETGRIASLLRILPSQRSSVQNYQITSAVDMIVVIKYFLKIRNVNMKVPAADAKLSQEAMNETFYLTNICPQVGDGFNRDCIFPSFEN